METGSELSQTVATFIVQKLLLDDQGLHFVCQTAERFYAVTKVLSKMLPRFFLFLVLVGFFLFSHQETCILLGS